MKKPTNALRILVDQFQPKTESFRKFLNLLGEWYKETDGGRRPEKPLEVESAGTNGRMKKDLKSWGFPCRLLPAIKRFKIQLGQTDKLAEAFGMKRRMPGKLIFDVYSPNLAINRYLWHMAGRLYRCRDNPDKFWLIGKMLLRSTAYRTACINHVLHNWHRKIPYYKVLQIAKEVGRLVDDPKAQADIKRKYIPKTGNRWRPLGVPSPAWRVYSHMWQNLLTMFLQPHISPHQHGFLPGKGVLTAWKEIMEWVVHKPYIKEYDLRNFFGEVEIGAVDHALWSTWEVPQWVCDTLSNINRSLTDLGAPGEDLTPEPERGVVLSPDGTPNPAYAPSGNGSLTKEEMSIRMKERMRVNEVTPEQLALEASELDWEGASTPSEWWGTKRKGLPQGLATSPILSIALLSKVLTSRLSNQVAYADDFIMAGDTRNSCELPQIEGRPGWVCVPKSESSTEEWQERAAMLKVNRPGLPAEGGAISAVLESSREDYLGSMDTREEVPLERYPTFAETGWSWTSDGGWVREDPTPVRWSWSETGGWDWYIPWYPLTSPTMRAMMEAGVEINEEKSGWVRMDGVWLKPLKFLGVEYNGREFRAATRKGATLKFDSYQGLLAHLQEVDRKREQPTSGDMWNLRPDMETYLADLSQKGWQEALRVVAANREFSEDLLGLPSGLRRELSGTNITRPWEYLFKSKLYGFFMARMQSDSWQIGIDQDFSYDFIETSWGGMKRTRWLERSTFDAPITIFNASSAASHCLAQDILAQIVRPQSPRRKLTRRVPTGSRSPSVRRHYI